MLNEVQKFNSKTQIHFHLIKMQYLTHSGF